MHIHICMYILIYIWHKHICMYVLIYIYTTCQQVQVRPKVIVYTYVYERIYAYTYLYVNTHICIDSLPTRAKYPPCDLFCMRTHCSKLQHTATHCNILQHTTTHCNTLQHTATHCNKLQRLVSFVRNSLPKRAK